MQNGCNCAVFLVAVNTMPDSCNHCEYLQFFIKLKIAFCSIVSPTAMQLVYMLRCRWTHLFFLNCQNAQMGANIIVELYSFQMTLKTFFVPAKLHAPGSYASLCIWLHRDMSWNSISVSYNLFCYNTPSTFEMLISKFRTIHIADLICCRILS